MANITILLPDLRGGGVERIRLVLAQEFACRGHQVEFILMQARGELLTEAQEKFSVIDLDCPRVRSLPSVLHRYLRSHSPDALLVAMWPLTTIAPVVARLTGFRGSIVVSEHAILSAQYADWGRGHHIALRASMALGYRFANARVGVSRGVVQDIATLSCIPESFYQAIHNPAAPHPNQNLQTIAATDALWGVQQGKRILSVGSFKKEKNHPLLLKAFQQFAQSPEARLMFLGTGPEEAILRSMVDKFGLSDRVIFAGFHPDPTPFYMTADLFALSSDNEGFGNVIVESLACGTPVVSTDCPSGPAEILENGRFGALVPVNDVPALVAAMNASVSSQHDTEALKRRAADFTPEIAARKYLDLLDL